MQPPRHLLWILGIMSLTILAASLYYPYLDLVRGVVDSRATIAFYFHTTIVVLLGGIVLWKPHLNWLLFAFLLGNFVEGIAMAIRAQFQHINPGEAFLCQVAAGLIACVGWGCGFKKRQDAFNGFVGGFLVGIVVTWNWDLSQDNDTALVQAIWTQLGLGTLGLLLTLLVQKFRKPKIKAA